MSVCRAQEDLRRLRQEATDLETKLAEVKSKIEKLSIYIELSKVYGGQTYLSPPVNRSPSPTGGRPKGGGISAAAVESAIAAITKAQSPLHTRKLLEILVAEGLEIGGVNPVANLSGFLSRSLALKNNRTHGWSLSAWPTPFAPGTPEEQSVLAMARIVQDSAPRSPLEEPSSVAHATAESSQSGTIE